ncbi:MAG: hypothetical protein ABIH42_05390 [Planctomycetota bacterium]
MGTAYTPGLKVSQNVIIKKTRRLPIKGEIAVNVGDKVTPTDVVARAYLPGDLRTVRIAEKMGLEPIEIEDAILVMKGDKVKKQDLLSKKKTFFGLFTAKCESPVTGTVEYYSPATGHMGIREEAKLLELDAYISGKILDIIPKEGVTIVTKGALVQGIFGVGGERQGIIEMACSTPDEPFTMDKIPPSPKGKILVGGSVVTKDVLNKLSELGASAVVVGGIVNEELTSFLGYEIGIAITGQEDIGLTLIVTEGFGRMTMAERTFKLFSELNGKEASVNGATQIRAGALRPEVIVPLDIEKISEQETSTSSHLLDIGTPVRIIRHPYFGKLATVTALPPELRKIPTGAKVRLLEAKLTDSEEIVSVPRANVEIIETE